MSEYPGEYRAKQAHPPELREKAFQLYRAGAKHSEIGVALNVPHLTVSGWSCRDKWRDRIKDEAIKSLSNKAGTVTSPSEGPQTEVDIATMTFGERQSYFRDKMSIAAARIAEETSTMTGKELIAGAEKIKKAHDIGVKSLDLEKSNPSVVVNVGLLAQASAQPCISASILPSVGTLSLVGHTGATPAHPALIDADASDREA